MLRLALAALLATGLLLDEKAQPREDWAGAQTRAASPAWAGWVAARRAAVDAWRARPRERAELVAGYLHDYVDPASGVPLAWTPDSPEPPDGGGEAQQRFRRAWVFQQRDYNIRRLGDAARLARLTGDAPLRDWAAGQLDFYADNYARWPLRTNNGRGRLFQNGLDEATASFTLLDAARLLAPQVSAERAARWRDGLFLPMAENLKTNASPRTNIALWHGAAVAAIGMRFRDAALVTWGLDSPGGLRATLAAGLTRDDLWNEGSFTYNQWVVAALSQLCTQAGVEGYGAQVAAEQALVARLLLAPLAFRFDDGSLPTPGDAAPMQAIDPGTMMAAYRVAPLWWGVRKARGYQSWDTLLDPPPALPPEPKLQPVATSDFPAVRMAVLRAGGWQAFVHYGQAAANHAQQEAPGYELQFGRTPVSRDAGTVSYGSRYHREYFTQGAANNVPLVDGQGQAAWAPGVVETFDTAASRLVVDHPTYRPGVTLRREWRLAAQGLGDETTLKAADGVARRLGVVFHSGCSITPLSGLQPAAGLQPPANAATGYWSGLVAYRAQARWSVRLACGGAPFTYTVDGPAQQAVFIGQGPATPLPATRSLLYYETQAGEARFNAAISG